jgi:hypothetical protein
MEVKLCTFLSSALAVIFTHRTPYPWGRSPTNPLGRRMAGTQELVWTLRRSENCQPLLGIEPQFPGPSARCLLSTLTEVSRWPRHLFIYLFIYLLFSNSRITQIDCSSFYEFRLVRGLPGSFLPLGLCQRASFDTHPFRLYSVEWLDD